MARDREIANPFTKDLQITAIRGARNYLGDKLIRVAQPHRLLDPEAGPLIAVRLNLLTRKTLGGLETDLSGPGAAARRRGRSRACTPRARSPGSAAAACTATARWRAPSSAAACSPGASAGRAAGGGAVTDRVAIDGAGEPTRTPAADRPPQRPSQPGRPAGSPAAVRPAAVAASPYGPPPYGQPRCGPAAACGVQPPWGPRPLRPAVGPPRRAARARAGDRRRRAGLRAGGRGAHRLAVRLVLRLDRRLAVQRRRRRLHLRAARRAGHRGHGAGGRPAGLGRRCSSSAGSWR